VLAPYLRSFSLREAIGKLPKTWPHLKTAVFNLYYSRFGVCSLGLDHVL